MKRFVTFLFGILIVFSVFAFSTHVKVDMSIDGQVFFNIDYEQVDNSYRPYLIMDDAYAVSPEFYMISEETLEKRRQTLLQSEKIPSLRHAREENKK